jgi:hypothetical protein
MNKDLSPIKALQRRKRAIRTLDAQKIAVGHHEEVKVE